MIGVVLVGATGSIGRSTLDVVRALGPGARLVGAFAGRNADGLAAIRREFGPRYCAAIGGGSGGPLEEAIADPETTVVVSAAAGAAGLPASLLAVRHGRRLALANKESMVMAGPLLLREAARTGAEIVPVDSEHSAIFQALRAGRREEIRKVILTASGGPFRTWPAERIAEATPADALRHPTWSMGRKISIDSATLMNKALELIEAHALFGLAPEEIEVVVHPQSIVHGMVEFVDGSVVAQMGKPDMRLPIQYALSWPERRGPSFARFDVRDFASLTFEAPDRVRFPALDLGERAVRAGGTAGAVLNAANEVAVERFLEGEIRFPDIWRTAEAVLSRARIVPDPELQDIHAADLAAREEARKWPT
ncbi:MAG TPA: 1-deoxy-D-xylulose-5-phosphate reductoisomerase [Planctomycetota bacterium]|nr:1-deoxy-D-xylulose-5-phosphate reductoisomerase [Planctomycetota bacterium]